MKEAASLFMKTNRFSRFISLKLSSSGEFVARLFLAVLRYPVSGGLCFSRASKLDLILFRDLRVTGTTGEMINLAVLVANHQAVGGRGGRG